MKQTSKLPGSFSPWGPMKKIRTMMEKRARTAKAVPGCSTPPDVVATMMPNVQREARGVTAS